jgi:parvulin-like peptidyl-prolyl isomerase
MLIGKGIAVKKLFLLAFLVVVASLRAEMQRFDGIVAYVDDKVVTMDTVLNELRMSRQLWNTSPDMQAAETVKYFPVFRDLLIERILILKEYEASGASLPAEALNERIKQVIAESYGGNEAALKHELRRGGITYAAWQKQVRENMIVQAMRHLQVEKKIYVSPKRIREYYAAHPEKFSTNDGVQLQTILLAPAQGRATAEKLLTDLRNGADFAALARQHSTDQYASAGGDTGFIKPEDNYAPEAVAIIKNLKIGEVSEIFEVRGYCQIFKKIAVKDQKCPPLQEIWQDVERAVHNELAQERYAQWVEELRSRAHIRYVELDF